ncbi:hypothetical protein [Erythrobacter sp.]|uniref:hypothetical protein n=1 Tax=Erythrobacter sp. TaxID=1042 RepID=UPI001B19F0C0|nr:hypothetical protein [Erythrobacter sp.]MBO6526284.1 hypothetical protein [Erythrobacter sp.]MBO6530537.1 hypothetical protein [Erythrobacter sp.]
MIDNAVFLIAAYGAMAAGLSATVAKVSPSIGPKLRHLFSGAAPLAAVLAARLDGADSVTLQGMDLFAAGGLVVFGVITSSVVGKFVPTQQAGEKRLTSR